MAAEHSGDISPGRGGQSSAPSLPNNAPDRAGASEANAGAKLGVAASTTSRGDDRPANAVDERGTIKYDNGDVYEGCLKDVKPHGKGVLRYPNGDVYEGEWKDGRAHGRGVYRYSGGDVYDGEWKEDKKHGRGVYRDASGNSYDGEWKDDMGHGKGTKKLKNGDVYEGEFKNGMQHGKGTLTCTSDDVRRTYEGQWVEGKMHGKLTVKFAPGDIYEGVWTNGKKESKGKMTWANGDVQAGFFECSDGRMLRSQQSQQRRLEKNVAIKVCENCGADDQNYKLRACSGCGLALYCSLSCQREARGSHRRICSIVSELPPRDADRLALKYERGKMVDLDAGLRYGTKYMDNMKHLEIDIREMAINDAIKLSAKQLSSLLRSKRGALSSFSWETKACNYYDEWGNELHGLKHLRLVNMYCDEVQHIQDVLSRQTSTLMVLILPQLQIDWHRAKCRRTFALAVASCKSLVKLQLDGCVLMDSDLKIMLQDLPNLRLLHLARHPDDSHEFTDNTCGLIARKCPGLQELDLRNHVHLSVRGVRKIFYGCPHLRAFYTSSLKLRSEDVRSLLDTAPQLMYLSLNERLFAGENLDEIIEATGGRTLIQFNDVRDCYIYEPREGVSAETRETYDRQIELGDEVIRRSHDPDVMNEWEHLVEG